MVAAIMQWLEAIVHRPVGYGVLGMDPSGKNEMRKMLNRIYSAYIECFPAKPTFRFIDLSYLQKAISGSLNADDWLAS